MTQLTPVHLTFHSGLHIGMQTGDLAAAGRHVPSDTLFAALTAAHHLAGGDMAAWNAAFASDPVALFSSAFPYAGKLRFFPLPVPADRMFTPETLKELGKAFKRTAYLSEGLLRRWLGGEWLDDYRFKDEKELSATDRGLALQDGTFWLLAEEVDQLPPLPPRSGPSGKGNELVLAQRRRPVYHVGRVPRVTVDRISSGANIFYAGRTTFAKGCGLWFGIQWRRPEADVGGMTARRAVERALALLQDSGLGGERTAGYGSFTYRNEAALTLPTPVAGQPAYLLSRYAPVEADIAADVLGEGAAYKIEAVGGFLHSPGEPGQLRRTLRLIAEGSVIRQPAKLPGWLADVQPNHDTVAFPHAVWRFGYALAAGRQEGSNG